MEKYRDHELENERKVIVICLFCPQHILSADAGSTRSLQNNVASESEVGSCAEASYCLCNKFQELG